MDLNNPAEPQILPSMQQNSPKEGWVWEMHRMGLLRDTHCHCRMAEEKPPVHESLGSENDKASEGATIGILQSIPTGEQETEGHG